MRFIRVLGAIVSFYGLTYIVYGLEQSLGMVEYRANAYIIELNLSIGVITFVIGIGLLLAKEWARNAWLVATTVLLAQHIYFLGMAIVDRLSPTGQILNVILITFLFLIAWLKLTTSSVKQHFQ
jgi:uncharacterized membrane protein (DUF2068 family)